ncbi:MAG TPA: hypothetical protein VFI73_05010 [Candidatus Nitrosopolaris sp.]|nr:hypothetical protein [Candidatus Nitrosopolaris sp.]
MRIILPENISERIGEFLLGNQDFPFVQDGELICVLFLFGRPNNVDNNEKWEVMDLASKTVYKFNIEIERCKNSPKTRMNTESIRSEYLERELQIRTEEKKAVLSERIANDPTLLSYCFVHHVSYYNQEYFFQIYGPLKGFELLKDLRSYLEGRMIMLGFNRKNEKFLPFQHPIIPLYVWLKKHLTEKTD